MNREIDHPVLIVPGIMKCGTTSLHRYLSTHPEVSAAKKELNYFVAKKKWDKGTDWFKSHFDKRKRVWVDVSIDYTKRPVHPECADLIKQSVSDAKFVFLFRNPIDRLVSHYKWSVYKGYEKRPFEEAFNMDDPDNNYYLTMSKYHYLIKPYIDRFERDRMLVLDAAELHNETASVCSRIFSFMGVNPDFSHKKMEQKFNMGGNRHTPMKIGRWVLRPANHHGKIRMAFLRVSSRIFGKEVKHPAVNDELLSRLLDFLRPDIEALEKWSGCDFSHWYRNLH